MNKDEIGKDDVHCIAVFCKNELKPGGYMVLLANFS